MAFEIKSLAVNEASFRSSVTNYITASCWELKLNDAWRDSEILRVRAHKPYDGSTGLLDFLFIFLIKVTDFKSGDKDDDSDGTPFQSDGKTLSAYRMAFA